MSESTTIIKQAGQISLGQDFSKAAVSLALNRWREKQLMKTLHTYIYFFVLLALLLTSCRKEKTFEYSEIQAKLISDFNSGYQEYCNLDLTSDFELNAVQCSFYGDYQNAIDQATKNESLTPPPENKSFPSVDEAELIKTLEAILENPEADESYKASARNMLNLLATPSAKELFAQAKPVTAVNFIREKAKDYHFTLINEAHFNSQHRSFTHALLKPLWDEGYRYLALETLWYDDKDIHERGYPVSSTGYYTDDSNFGNLVREALKLGYTLVAYETQNGHGGTWRDRDQANNIYEQTWKKDKHGKVLIHAGYGHIFETGSERYEPMGFQLKKLINQDILTIDQERMIGFNDSTKQHPYYREAAHKFDFNEATVFLSDTGKVIVDPVNSIGIDIQVYHPETKFVNGRPDWMIKENIKQIPLSTELLDYTGHLLQAVHTGEANDAVPVDQFVISEGKVFMLGTGHYDLRIINCDGDLIATLGLEVN